MSTISGTSVSSARSRITYDGSSLSERLFGNYGRMRSCTPRAPSNPTTAVPLRVALVRQGIGHRIMFLSGHEKENSALKKGVLWMQRDRLFSRWKERYFVLTKDYLACFKKGSKIAHSEMGGFIFKVSLAEVEGVEWIERKGDHIVAIITPNEGRILLRSRDGLHDWLQVLKVTIAESKNRREALRNSMSREVRSLVSEIGLYEGSKIPLHCSYSDSPILPRFHSADLPREFRGSTGRLRIGGEHRGAPPIPAEMQRFSLMTDVDFLSEMADDEDPGVDLEADTNTPTSTPTPSISSPSLPSTPITAKASHSQHHNLRNGNAATSTNTSTSTNSSTHSSHSQASTGRDSGVDVRSAGSSRIYGGSTSSGSAIINKRRGLIETGVFTTHVPNSPSLSRFCPKSNDGHHRSHSQGGQQIHYESLSGRSIASSSKIPCLSLVPDAYMSRVAPCNGGSVDTGDSRIIPAPAKILDNGILYTCAVVEHRSSNPNSGHNYKIDRSPSDVYVEVQARHRVESERPNKGALHPSPSCAVIQKRGSEAGSLSGRKY